MAFLQHTELTIIIRILPSEKMDCLFVSLPFKEKDEKGGNLSDLG